MGEGEPDVLTERDVVNAWRVGEFLRMGYDLDAAEELGASSADLHRVESMLEDGCPRDLARVLAV